MNRRLRLPLSAVLAAVLSTGLVATSHPTPPPPTDFIATKGQLSQPDYPNTVVEKSHLVMPHDGTDIYLEITKPDPAKHGNGPWPVILEASPYHGTIATRIGDRIFPDPKNPDGSAAGLTGYFAPRGYAVVMMDLRGTGRSGGCLDHLGPNDAKDLKYVIEWLADQAWSNGRVGMTGHSYVGSTPVAAAAQRPQGLATIIPSAGLASMYDHQFLGGVPWLLQWAGPQWAYEALALSRHLPPGLETFLDPTNNNVFGKTGDDFGKHPTNTGCGLPQSALVSGPAQVTGQYAAWHAARDWSSAASDVDIPVFMIHGVHDNAARITAADWFFARRFDQSSDKVWLGQWDHGSSNGRCGSPTNARVSHPTCRFDQFKYAVHAWFDKHLKQMDVDTGPAVEVFLNGDSAAPLGSATSPTNPPLDPEREEWGRTVLTDTAWRAPSAYLTLHADGADLRSAAPATTGSRTFSTTANAVQAHVSSGSVSYSTGPLAEDVVLLGKVEMQLTAAVRNSQVAHLIATIARRDPASGQMQEVGYCAIQPSLRGGRETVTPIVPDAAMKLTTSCYTVAAQVPAGQEIVVTIGTQARQFATFGSERQVTVFTGPDHTWLKLPVVDDPSIYPDVPLRER